MICLRIEIEMIDFSQFLQTADFLIRVIDMFYRLRQHVSISEDKGLGFILWLVQKNTFLNIFIVALPLDAREVIQNIGEKVFLFLLQKVIVRRGLLNRLVFKDPLKLFAFALSVGGFDGNASPQRPFTTHLGFLLLVHGVVYLNLRFIVNNGLILDERLVSDRHGVV